MAVELPTNIVINGMTTAGFESLASRLQAMGSVIEQIGEKIREFESDSVNVYRDYEDNMLAAEYALSAQYKSATQLSKIMNGLDTAAQEWAGSTIFHTNDVAKAINEAAHAGWSYEEILIGIPAAMKIAQAGGLDLSAGLDYLVKMMGSTGTEFDSMEKVIDQWSMAANISATNVQEMGEAFMGLGASAQFGDTTQELFTMLAVLANVGTTGSQAGTALRGAMMRIIAPTTKAENAMKLLGADAGELEDVLSDTNVTKAAKTLQGLGFSAYDSSGNLLPMIDIFTNLYNAIQPLNEEAQNEILAAIFPTRNISTAKAFMAAIGNGKMAEIFEGIGDSEGYAAKGADIMMGGLTGAIELLASKWEEFQLQIGEQLAPWIEEVAGGLGKILDKINGMDEPTLAAIAGSLTTIGAAGPIMLGASGVVRAVSTLGLTGTALLLAAVGAGALAGYLTKLNEINFSENFGTMELDLDTLGSHVDSLKTSFDSQMAAVDEWEKALENAEEQYAAKSSQLSEMLLTDVLTGKKLSEQDIENLHQYASDLVQEVWNGIENAEASDKSFLQAIFGDRSQGEGEENVYNAAVNVVDSYYEGLYGEARQIGEKLRAQMTLALQDGTLDEGERQAIQSSVDRLNQIQAEISSQLDKEEYYTQLSKAQRVSWDTVRDYLDENAEKQAEELARFDESYDVYWGRYRAAFDYALENGTVFTDLNGNTRKVTEEDWAAFDAQFRRERAEARQGIVDKYGGLSALAFDALMNDSEFSEAWNYLKYMQQNGISLTDENGIPNIAGMGFTPETWELLSDQLVELSQADRTWGGLGKGRLTKVLEPFADNPLMAGFLTMLGNAFEAGTSASAYGNSLYEYWQSGGTVDPTNLFSTERSRELPGLIGEKQAQIDELNRQMEALEAERAAAEARLAGNDYNLFAGYFGNASRPGDEEFLAGYGGKYAQLAAQIEAAEAEAAKLQAELDGMNGKPLVVETEVDDTAVMTYSPPPKTMKIIPYIIGQTYAEGGRATSASIFGEAGAEWAIPEEHTERTAELLDAARRASGFTWGELLTRYGGLNADARGGSMVVHYSPVINAQDARGVEAVLAADKERMLRLVRDALREQRTMDTAEVYG